MCLIISKFNRVNDCSSVPPPPLPSGVYRVTQDAPIQPAIKRPIHNHVYSYNGFLDNISYNKTEFCSAQARVQLNFRRPMFGQPVDIIIWTFTRKSLWEFSKISWKCTLWTNSHFASQLKILYLIIHYKFRKMSCYLSDHENLKYL